MIKVILFLIPYILTFIAGGVFGMILMACLVAGAEYEEKINNE